TSSARRKASTTASAVDRWSRSGNFPRPTHRSVSMHELALAQSITDLVVDYARRERIARISRVVVEIGIAASVEPDALLFCFPIVADETPAAGAELSSTVFPYGRSAKSVRQNTLPIIWSRHAPPAAASPARSLRGAKCGLYRS